MRLFNCLSALNANLTEKLWNSFNLQFPAKIELKSTNSNLPRVKTTENIFSSLNYGTLVICTATYCLLITDSKMKRMLTC